MLLTSLAACRYGDARADMGSAPASAAAQGLLAEDEAYVKSRAVKAAVQQLQKACGEWPPKLPATKNKYHLFKSKDERYRCIAAHISSAIAHARLKCWLTQEHKNQGQLIDITNMQQGVDESASSCLSLPTGIGHANRKWVWRAEIVHGIKKGNHLCVLPMVL